MLLSTSRWVVLESVYLSWGCGYMVFFWLGLRGLMADREVGWYGSPLVVVERIARHIVAVSE
jgi:hypothetical protein